MSRKTLKVVVLAAIGIAIMLMVIVMIAGALSSGADHLGLGAWLDQPISQLKIGHLIAILFFIGLTTSR